MQVLKKSLWIILNFSQETASKLNPFSLQVLEESIFRIDIGNLDRFKPR
jgi:hypothetical protein